MRDKYTMDFCTLAEVREELIKAGTTTADDTAISNRIPRVTTLINDYCGHWLDDRTVTNETRRGDQVLISPYGDLQVTTQGGQIRTLTAASYSTDFKTWITLDVASADVDFYVANFVNPPINSLGADITSLRRSRLYARLSYVGGYNPTPADVNYAATRWVSHLYLQREITPGDGRGGGTPALPHDVTEALLPFMRRRP